jgi:hypothetical protein
MLHRPGVRLRVECGGRFLVHQQRADAAPTERVCQHRPARTASGDENGNTALLHEGYPFSGFVKK